ncbi:hypothetical protein Ccrd_010851 [Cynara cardunculus var. scolymus]|uniref:Methyltransferase domain-containing protein n=1 Tax=Cynara cardunculus var. scolymus TaxID=59895 RepID=A0A124SHW2_CYNCS|nr:hypothetical protein Ccrd_010851 [Cynara cardunculus var. scolymus]
MDEPSSEAKRTAVGPPSVLAYLDPNYWNDRFTCEDHYEWLKDYSHFRHLIQQHITPTSSVLELGCGNSQLCDELYKEGITKLTCIDLSSVAVQKMQTRLLSKGYKGLCISIISSWIQLFDNYIESAYVVFTTGEQTHLGFLTSKLRTSDLQNIKVLEGDMLDLSFADESFDVVIEKGTMDVLFVDSGDPWNPRPEAVNRAMTMLQGVHRVLKPNGIFISIAFGQPHFRRPLFSAPEFTWSIEYATFGDGFHYFFYILRKGQRSSSEVDADVKKVETPSLCLYQDELDDEDYLFRTNIDEMGDDR